VALLKYGAIDNVADVLLVALGEEKHRPRVALWGGKQPFSVWVLTDTFEEGSDGALHALQTFLFLFGALLETLACAPARTTQAVKINDWTWRPGR